MLFSRIIVAAISVVSVTAIPFLNLNPPKPALDSIARRDATLPPLQVCTNQMRQLKNTVPDIMTAPQDQREAGFIDLTSKALKIVQDCNASVKSQPASFKMSDADTSEQMNKFSQATVRTVRACKSVRSSQVADNIAKMTTEMETLQTTVQGLLPSLIGDLLNLFTIRIGRLDSIRAATAA